VTVTIELFHPFTVAAGEIEYVIPGRVLAMFSVTFAVLGFAAASVTVPVIIWFAPSVLTV
jgi:hypothetical protein